MTETNERRPPLDTPEAAIYTGVKSNYLEKLRCNGSGPVYIKHAGIVRYDPDDLDAWLESGKRLSTSTTQQYALVEDGALAFYSDRARNASYPVIVNGNHLDLDDTRNWLPVVNEDSEPFDLKIHWRLPPTYRVEAHRVVRVYPVVIKGWEHA
jgi:hypothetical protein